MATVNFSVPADVRDLFNATFAHTNKSAVIAELMREAVERAARQRASQRAIESILKRRSKAPARSAAALAVSRKLNRV
jgi:hypothetical protein